MHIVTPDDSARVRIERLLICQQGLRQAHNDRHMEFEVEVAIEELCGGYPNGHTETVENWARVYNAGGAA